MKKLHLHVSVADLNQSIVFYSSLFGVAPSVTKDDYAKWMLDDPAVNFAISSRSSNIGLDHVGIQAENKEELAEIKTRLDAAEMNTVSQEETACCYSKSDKHWVQDPSGIAWETYHTLESVPTFNGQEAPSETDNSACCAPAPQAISIISKNKGGCC